MDPLAALSLAGTITQFVGFAASLISKSTEIYRSSTGSTQDALHIGTVYGKLRNFSRDMNARSLLQAQDHTDPNVPNQIIALQELLNTCQEDCDKLLGIIHSLKTNPSKSRLASLHKAIRALLNESEIKRLDDRLQRAQSTIVLIVCFLSSSMISDLTDQLKSIVKDNRVSKIQQEAQYLNVQTTLLEIRSRIDETGKSPQPVQADDIASLRKNFGELSIITQNLRNQQSIINSLSFKTCAVRHGSIPYAHEKTFKWVFQQGHSKATNLLDWLRHGDDVFWVSGKPGSGKSTLMKYLADNDNTKAALEVWSGPRKVLIASHYFWIAGTAMQKSQQGLFQTLIREILKQCPEMVEIACGSRWSLQSGESFSESWELSELRHAMHTIARQDTLPVNICFFIDGLDEYDGEHLQFTRDLLDLSKSRYIKLCVSSRPLNVFEDAFGASTSKKLYMQDLTANDIRNFTTYRLSSHPRWGNLVSQPQGPCDLVDRVTEKSQGVFLWVFLVTKLLREGLTNDDDMHDLYKRLDSFPGDLEGFFEHMLNSVESFYHEKMATSILMAVKAEEPLPAMFYYFLDQEHQDQDYAISMQPNDLSNADIEICIARIIRRLNAYSRGLLEVYNGGVHFVHRTAADFLRTRAVANMLTDKCPPWYNGKFSILRGYLAEFKTPRTKWHYYDSKIVDMLKYVSGMEMEKENCISKAYELLDSLEAFVYDDRFLSTHIGRCSFRQYVLIANIPGYVRRNLSCDRHYFTSVGISPLTYLFDNMRAYWLTAHPTTHLELIEVLLTYEPKLLEQLSPSEDARRVDQPWTSLVALICESPSAILFGSWLEGDMFELFLDYGANPNALVSSTVGFIGYGRAVRKAAWIQFFLSIAGSLLDDRYNDFLRVLDTFIHAGAALHSAILFEDLAADESQPTSEMILRWCQTAMSRARLPSEFRDSISHRLHNLARKEDLDVDLIWPEVRCTLNRPVARRIKESSSCVEPGERLTSSQTNVPKKRTCSSEDDGRSSKILRGTEGPLIP